MLCKRTLLLSGLTALFSSAPFAQAQFGAYADFTADRFSGLQSSPQAPAGATINGSVNPTGGTFGVFYDFKTFGPVRLGADARFVHTSDNRSAQTNFAAGGTRIYSTLGGVRASFHTPIKLLVPYVQASAGLARSDYGLLFATDSSGRTKPAPANNVEYHVYAGADYNLLPYIGWRVVEVGYGGIDPFGTYSHNYPIANISTGIVFRFGGN